MKIRIGAIAAVLAFLLATNLFASGDKNHGTTGKGSTSTGSTSPGSAKQLRGGR